MGKRGGLSAHNICHDDPTMMVTVPGGTVLWLEGRGVAYVSSARTAMRVTTPILVQPGPRSIEDVTCEVIRNQTTRGRYHPASSGGHSGSLEADWRGGGRLKTVVRQNTYRL